MAVARLVAAPFPLPPATRLTFAPLSFRRAAVSLRAAAGDEVVVLGEAKDDGGKAARKQSERRTYLVAAVMSSLGITSMAAAAVYYRFAWQMEVRISQFPFPQFASVRLGLVILLAAGDGILIRRQGGGGGEIPATEMVGTFALSVGAAVSAPTAPRVRLRHEPRHLSFALRRDS
jgi:beta-carotene 3-hydroxylase